MSDQQAKNDAKTKPPETTQAEYGAARGPFYQQSDHDKLASDQYGEELNHNASIWRMYAEEAKEQDAESVREKNENLNNLLLFATLFSAIVTAFIMDSTRLLEQDSSEISTQLLLALLQSQRRIEAGTPDLTQLPVEIPKFKPSSIARLINVLWFTSLMISLGVAVVAILTKEWLTAFLAYKTRHAHKYALERQERLTNQRTWKMLPIIDLLPTLLNFALFLFVVGLIIRLWILDFVVAGVTTLISVGSGGIYVFFIVLGALLKACPYKSQISRYSQKLIPEAILDHFNKHFSATADISNEGSLNQKDLHILNWLFDNSWDPVLSTYVTQALAGLRSLRLEQRTFHKDSKTEGGLNCSSNHKKRSPDISLLFKMGAQAVDQLELLPIKSGNELAMNGGSSAARLAIALSEIYPHASNWKTSEFQETTLESQQVQGRSSMQAEGNPWEETDFSRACKITNKAFRALDLLWVETSPPLTLMAYAYLAAAELKILKHDIEIMNLPEARMPADPNHRLVNMPPSKRDQGGGATVSRATYTATIAGSAIAPITTHEGIFMPIHDLLRRCTRALAQTTVVIKSALKYEKINLNQELQCALTDLLVQTRMLIQEAGRSCEKSLRQIATSTWDGELSIRFIAERNTIQRVNYRGQTQNLAIELFESLVYICRSCNVTDPRLEGLRSAAFQILVPLWFHHFQEWTCGRYLPGDANFPASWIPELNQIFLQTPPYSQRTLADVASHQSILFTHIAYILNRFGPQIKMGPRLLPIQGVVDSILDSVISNFGTLVNAEKRFKSDPSKDDTRPNYEWMGKIDVKDWVACAIELSSLHGSENGADRNRGYKLYCCTLRVVELAKALDHSLVTVITRGCEVETLLDLIHVALGAPWRDVATPIIQNILDIVTNIITKSEKLGDREGEYFLSNRGFYILTKIGQVETNRIAVAVCVSHILQFLYRQKARVSQKVILSLLEATSYVWDPEVTKQTEFSRDPYIVSSIFFQLEAFLDNGNPISYFVTEMSSSIQVLLKGVEDWVRAPVRSWEIERIFLQEGLPHPGLAMLDRLQRQVQKRIDMGQPPWGTFSTDEYGAQYYEPDYKRFPKDQEPQKSIINPQDPAKGSGNSTVPGPGARARSNVRATSRAASSPGAPEVTKASGVVGEASKSDQILDPQMSNLASKPADTDAKSEISRVKGEKGKAKADEGI